MSTIRPLQDRGTRPGAAQCYSFVDQHIAAFVDRKGACGQLDHLAGRTSVDGILDIGCVIRPASFGTDRGADGGAVGNIANGEHSSHFPVGARIAVGRQEAITNRCKACYDCMRRCHIA